MWLLTVFVAGMLVFSSTYATMEECQREGRARIMQLVHQHKLGVGYNCKKMLN